MATSASWERYYTSFEELIDDHVFPPHALEGNGTKLVEFYEGDYKNPPHAVLECFDRKSAERWAEVLSEWGCFTQIEGTEIYIEPYKLL